MASATTAFRPDVHGFKFKNQFTLKLEYVLPLIGEIDLDDLMVGLCGGMCFTALDYFNSGISIPSRQTVPETGSNLRKRLISKQLQSLIPPDGILKVLTWTAKDDSYVWRHTAGREFRKLRTRLDKAQPAVLILIRVGRGEDPGKNHQVVARSYHYDEQSGRVRIGVYDPNRPEKEPRLSLNIASPRTGINAKQSNEGPFRGFFVVDYKPDLLTQINDR
jgi:hypothetical protein